MSIPGLFQATRAKDQYMNDPQYRPFWRANCEIMWGYSPFMDQVLPWHERVLCYVDTYAVQPPNPIIPEEICQDAAGNLLKIAWQDGAGNYPEYAGNIMVPSFQGKLLSALQSIFKLGYKGFFLDDVNTRPSFVDLAGKPATPNFTLDQWQWYMETLMETIRREFSNAIIIQNTPWWDITVRTAKAANYLNIERGWMDANFKPVSYVQLSQKIALIHSWGRSIIDDESSVSNEGTFLPLFNATYAPGDLLAVEDATPLNWPA